MTLPDAKPPEKSEEKKKKKAQCASTEKNKNGTKLGGTSLKGAQPRGRLQLVRLMDGLKL